MTPDDLTPRQQRIFEQVFLPAARPQWPADAAALLRARLEDELVGAAATLDATQWVGKSPAQRVLRCEGLFVAQRDAAWEWTVPLARGKVAHRALSVLLANPSAGSALAVTERVLEGYRADPDNDFAKFIAGLDAVDASDLLATANNVAAQFMGDWPPRIRGMKPRFDWQIKADLCDGRIRLVGEPDLVLGFPHGTEARTVIADFKTGDHSSGHLDDLRWYALLQTLRDGVPPFRLVSYYLESGEVIVEDVTDATLDAAARRAVAAARAIVELRTRTPALTPSHHCKWCPARGSCPDGAAFLSALAREADD